MKAKTILIFAFLQLSALIITTAHPGSGIVVDKDGHIYFTDTGKGVWKLDGTGKLSYLPSSKFHWMTIDSQGGFAASPKYFGQYFERVTAQHNKPALIMCSDFPLVVGKDGNIYYADTRAGSSKIIRRTPDGNESVLASNRIFEFISGIAAGPDGSLFITEASNINANTIRKITLNGTVSTIATFAGANGKDFPLETASAYCRGLAVDATGNIYVAATGSRSVIKITAQGNITTLLNTANPWTPTGVTIHNNDVYVLEWHDVSYENLEVRTAWIPRVRKIGKDGITTTIATITRN